MAIVWWRAGVNARQYPPYGKTAVTAAGGGNLGGRPQDLKEAEHNGDNNCTAAGARDPCIYQEKLQCGSGENGPGTHRRKLYFTGGSTAPKQQIVCSRSFGERVTTYEAMRQAVCQYAERAAEKLRGERQFCRHIAVFVKTSPFAVNEPYYGNMASEKLLIPTQDTQDIIAAAVRALDRIWVDGHRYAKAGCMLNDFAPDGVSLLNLFDDTLLRSNSNQLMKVVDGINHSGLGKVWFAGRGIASEWQMKREMLSPAYTTRWSELPVAKL